MSTWLFVVFSFFFGGGGDVLSPVYCLTMYILLPYYYSAVPPAYPSFPSLFALYLVSQCLQSCAGLLFVHMCVVCVPPRLDLAACFFPLGVAFVLVFFFFLLNKAPSSCIFASSLHPDRETLFNSSYYAELYENVATETV